MDLDESLAALDTLYQRLEDEQVSEEILETMAATLADLNAEIADLRGEVTYYERKAEMNWRDECY